MNSSTSKTAPVPPVLDWLLNFLPISRSITITRLVKYEDYYVATATIELSGDTETLIFCSESLTT